MRKLIFAALLAATAGAGWLVLRPMKPERPHTIEVVNDRKTNGCAMYVDGGPAQPCPGGQKLPGER